MSLLDNYAGPFDPKVGLESFSRTALSQLGREFLLNGHLQDRVGLPLVAKQFGGDAYVQFSIEEWMGASPVSYTHLTLSTIYLVEILVIVIIIKTKREIKTPMYSCRAFTP